MLADEISNKITWNKCHTCALSIATLSFKMRFDFFHYNSGTLRSRDSEFRKLSWLQ